MRWGTSVVGAQVDWQDIRALDELSDKFGMSRSAMVRAAITEFINNNRMLINADAKKNRVSKIVDLLLANGDITE